MKLIHVFIAEEYIKKISSEIKYVNKPEETTIKLYRTDNKIFFNNKYFEIEKEHDSELPIGFIRILEVKKLDEQYFPSKKDYYQEIYNGKKKVIGVNTFSIQNKKNLILISNDLQELQTIINQLDI